MPVAVNSPNRRPEKDPLDTILKGLSIATQIYGIKEGREKAELLAQQTQANREKTELDKQVAQAQIGKLDREKQDFERRQSGIFIPEELTGKNVSMTPVPGAVPAKVHTPEGVKDVYLTAPKKEADPVVAALRMQQLKDAERKSEEAALAKTPEGRVKSLASTDKQRLDNAKLGLVAVQGMADALSQGQNTFSLIGDNDFTQQRTLFEEALGRMQSGGAITKDEEMRFRAMAPTWRDSADIQRKKLVQLQAEMQSRLGTLGFEPEDLGIQVTDISGKQIEKGGTIGRSLNPKANANLSESKAPKPGDVEAGYRFKGGDPGDRKNWEKVR